jgi:hypothetical protein
MHELGARAVNISVRSELRTMLSRVAAVVSFLLHTPVVHFAGLGVVLLLMSGTVGRWRSEPGTTESSRAADSEILYRVAVALGIDDRAEVIRQRLAQLGEFLELDRVAGVRPAEQQARDLGFVATDPIIRRHIEQLADLALHHGGAAALPSDAEVERYYESKAEQFVEPPRIRMRQIYFSFDRRGASTEAAARAELERLRARHVAPDEVPSLGDPLALAIGANAPTRTDLERVFGVEFARALDAVPAGAWAGPLRSAYGLHLVWVYERRPAERQPLSVVRNRIVHRLTRAHSESLAARRLDLLRQAAARQTP